MLISERNHFTEDEDRNGSSHHHDEEHLVSDSVAEETGNSSGDHYREIHDGTGERIMIHLVFSWGNLLHHEQCKSDESESISEILQHDAAADQKDRRRLGPCEPCVHQKRKIEDADEGEECFLQASMRYKAIYASL